MLRQAKALQYYPAEDFLQRISPLAKISVLISLSTFLFISQSVLVHLAIFFFSTVLFLFQPISFFKLHGSKVLIITTAFIGLLQLVFISEGNPVLNLYFFEITSKGILQSVSASARFISIILLSYLFVLSTDPGKFVLSLVGIGLPYRLGYTLITALRMIPMVKAEVEKILFAQITRGANYSPIHLKKTTINISRFLKVVLIAIFKRVNQLVISMDGRSFGLYDKRSTLSDIHFQRTDYMIIFLSLALILISIIWR